MADCAGASAAGASGTPGCTATQSAIAKERRASRKAAAACLARQRHKHFVNSLQDQGGGLRERVVQMRARRGKMGAICATHMMTLMEEKLLPERYAQLRTWLDGSVILDPPPLPTLDAIADGADPDAVAAVVASIPVQAQTPLVEKPRATARNPAAANNREKDADGDDVKTEDGGGEAKSKGCLDEELSKQLFMEQAVSAVGAALYVAHEEDEDEDDEEDEDEDDEMEGAYGEGAAAKVPDAMLKTTPIWPSNWGSSGGLAERMAEAWGRPGPGPRLSLLPLRVCRMEADLAEMTAALFSS